MKKHTKTSNAPKKALLIIALSYLAVWGLMMTNSPIHPEDPSSLPIVSNGTVSTPLVRPVSQKITPAFDERIALEQLLEQYIKTITHKIRQLQFQQSRNADAQTADTDRLIDALFEQKFQLEIFQNEVRQAEPTQLQVLKSKILQWINENQPPPLIS
ncbi:MAG: hypothetical protein KDC44_01475 [Phaeodactylibacter sp.]|nr:hypothetical protein [Phaeodactylibacter sp.]